MRMWKRRQPLRPWLVKKAERGLYGYPISTIAFYGQTDKLATKVAVSILSRVEIPGANSLRYGNAKMHLVGDTHPGACGPK